MRVVQIVLCCISMAQCFFGVQCYMTYCVSVFLQGSDQPLIVRFADPKKPRFYCLLLFLFDIICLIFLSIPNSLSWFLHSNLTPSLKSGLVGVFRSTFNTPPAMQHFDPNWHSQPYPQWENKEPAAPRVVQHHDFSSQPNHFPHQNTRAVSEVHQPLHQDIPPQNLEKHQNSETASVEVLFL